MIRRQRGIISVESKKLMTSELSFYKVMKIPVSAIEWK